MEKLYELKSQLPKVKTAINLPIDVAEVEITITFPDKRTADLTNKAESIMDLLVDAYILFDDSHVNVPKLTLRSGGVDKKNAGAEIEIKPDITGFYKDLA